MEIRLLKGAGVSAAKKSLRADYRDVQDFAIKVVQEAVREYGGEVRSVRFIHNRKVTATAYFTPMDYALTINLSEVRTLRDLVFAIGHEVCHSIQAAMEGPQNMLKRYRLLAVGYGYEHHPMEEEADDFGLAFEQELNYGNLVINTNTTSVFINRKVWMHVTGRA